MSMPLSAAAPQEVAVAARADSPFRWADLPDGILGKHVLPFLFIPGEWPGDEDIREIIRTNKVWQRAAIDLIKGDIRKISKMSLSRVNRDLSRYTCLRPISRFELLKGCSEKGIEYHITADQSLDEITKEVRQIEEAQLQVEALDLDSLPALSPELVDKLISKETRELLIANCDHLTSDHLRGLQRTKLTLLSIYATLIPEEDLIRIIEQQPTLTTLGLKGPDISDRMMDALVKTCSKSLRILTVSRCQAVTSHGWIHLLSNSPHLKVLEIDHGTHVTMPVLLSIPSQITTINVNNIPELTKENLFELANRFTSKNLGFTHNARSIDIHAIAKIERYASLYEQGDINGADQALSSLSANRKAFIQTMIERVRRSHLDERPLSLLIREAANGIINNAISG